MAGWTKCGLTTYPGISMATDEFKLKLDALAKQVGDTYSADVILYSGEVESGAADQMIRIARDPKRRKNVVLILTTRGGSPDAAYRIARCLRRYYSKLTLFIYGMCKSAGTLIAIGADELILSDFGEFGPLDVQLGKKDELFENISGLNITQSLTSLNTRTIEFFRSALMDLKIASRGQVSTKLASEIACSLAAASYEGIYSQIDPIQLGAIERAMNIASDYGQRLKTANVKAHTIDKLVSAYSSHSFVIDLEEAKGLFNVVRSPSDSEDKLGEMIAHVTRDQADAPLVFKLEVTQEQHHENDQQTEPSTEGADTGGVADNQAPIGEQPHAHGAPPLTVIDGGAA